MSKVEIFRCRLRAQPRLSLAVGMFAIAALAAVKPMSAQTPDQAAVERRIVTRVEPEYPVTLKRLYIGGVVRVETVVAANGAVTYGRCGANTLPTLRRGYFRDAAGLVVRRAIDTGL